MNIYDSISLFFSFFCFKDLKKNESFERNYLILSTITLLQDLPTQTKLHSNKSLLDVAIALSEAMPSSSLMAEAIPCSFFLMRVKKPCSSL